MVASAGMARLLFHRGPVNEGDGPLFVARLAQGRTRVGRIDACDVVLPDEQVSRSHCIIDQTSDGWELVDRSRNGTLLNGARAQRATLRDGDVLGIGPFTARFVVGAQEEAPPTERAQPERRDEEVVETAVGLAVSEPFLVIQDGPGRGQRVRLRGARLGVGGFGSRINLPDPALLKDHVRIRLSHGRAILEPGEGAAFLGPMRIRDLVPLYPGEDVRIGGTHFTIEWDTRTEAVSADGFGEMVGTSEAMRGVFGMLRRMSAHHAPILLIGESGTGKELAARAVHDASPRAGGAFVALNCGAITASLFESELFGHEKGAFTGATERRDGAFQRANKGTLFLDEVGELPEDAQAKLLRALESGEVRRVGGAEASYPDVRIVAATNRNLAEAVRAGRFRSDLYFRLAVLAVRIPPLRERREDIGVTAEAVARRLHAGLRIAPDALERLSRHDWPGNARELRNVITRAWVLGGDLAVKAQDITFNPLEEAAPGDGAASGPLALDEMERDMVEAAVRRHGGNRTHAARELGIARSTLIYKLRRWGLE
jgi:transcriptional regulator with AAA-type ATPase domain/pSer/pThr/pTyr-binding forkhead associated (FHA) protein